jgi:hypothetical protein
VRRDRDRVPPGWARRDAARAGIRPGQSRMAADRPEGFHRRGVSRLHGDHRVGAHPDGWRRLRRPAGTRPVVCPAEERLARRSGSLRPIRPCARFHADQRLAGARQRPAGAARALCGARFHRPADAADDLSRHGIGRA